MSCRALMETNGSVAGTIWKMYNDRSLSVTRMALIFQTCIKEIQTQMCFYLSCDICEIGSALTCLLPLCRKENSPFLSYSVWTARLNDQVSIQIWDTLLVIRVLWVHFWNPCHCLWEMTTLLSMMLILWWLHRCVLNDYDCNNCTGNLCYM